LIRLQNAFRFASRSWNRFFVSTRRINSRLIQDLRSQSLDVEKNYLICNSSIKNHTGYFAAVCGGMYRGPQQTGSYFRSTPLLV